MHYYFNRKKDLLAALVARLQDSTVDHRKVVVEGDVAESLRRLLAAGGAAVAIRDVEAAAALLALAVSYRHSVARHSDEEDPIDRELNFVASALQARPAR